MNPAPQATEIRPSAFGMVGLGAMGGGMAQSLLAAGHQVSGIDPDASACERAAAAGVQIHNELSTLLAESSIVVICLASTSALGKVYDMIASTPAEKPAMIVETSTIAPDRAQAFADISQASGRRQLEACLIGIARDAEAGQLYHFVGGKAEDLENAKEFLGATGRGHAHLGDIGSGAAAKVLNNAIGNTTMLAFTEAVVAGESIGVDAAELVRAISEAAGAGKSVVFDRHAHWITSDSNQPPNPINQKDMLEWGRMVGEESSNFPMLAEALRRFRDLPMTPGPVQSYAGMLKARRHGSEIADSK